MEAKEALNKIAVLLGLKEEVVKFEQMKLDDGVTVIEAEVFEAGQNVSIVAEDQTIPLPIGEYELEDGRKLVVEQEGIIGAIMDAETDVEVPSNEMPTEEMTAEPKAEERQPKSIVESTVRELRFTQEEMDAKDAEIESLKEQLNALKLSEVKEEESTDIVEFEEPAVEPLAFNPEAKNPIEHVDLAPKAEISMRDRILQSVYGK
jgi:hypothetical protein